MKLCTNDPFVGLHHGMNNFGNKDLISYPIIVKSQGSTKEN